MRICVIGAGAIGSLMAGKLSVSGQTVSILTRQGEHLRTIQREGLRIVNSDGSQEMATRLLAHHDASEVGPQDLAVLAVKAHQIVAVAADVTHLLHEETVVLTVQNGIPWWFFEHFGGGLEGKRLLSLDPDGAIARHLYSGRILGSIAYPAADRPEPGVVRVIEGDQFPVGELDGSRTDRAINIAAILGEAGFRSRVLTDIRSHLWVKAWGNLAFNPISALTGATLAGICRYPDTRSLAAEMMSEAAAIAELLGIRTRHTIEQRIAGAEAVGEHKTSMLQDLEAGNEMEIEALVGAFVELGRLTGVATPTIFAIYAAVKLLEATRQRPNFPGGH